MKIVLHILITLSVALGVLKLLVTLVEPQLTFFPYREIPETPEDLGVEYEEIFLPTSDGETICAWFLNRSDPLAQLVLFHGNGGNLSIGRLDFLVSLYRRRYSVFVFDYRGYGKSSGSPSERGLYLDARAAVSYFWRHLHQDPQRVVYFGRSLGGVTAAAAAAFHPPHGIILEGAFPDKKTLLAHYPLLRLLAVFSRYRLSTIHFLRKVNCPALVIHGEYDRVVPLAVGKRLFEQLEMSKEFYLVKGAEHADQYLIGAGAYWEHLENFVRGLDSKP